MHLMNVGAWILFQTAKLRGSRFRALTIVDNFTRESPAIEAGFSMTGKRSVVQASLRTMLSSKVSTGGCDKNA